MSDLDTSPYPAVHDLVNVMENPDRICSCVMLENKDGNESVHIISRRTCFFGWFQNI